MLHSSKLVRQLLRLVLQTSGIKWKELCSIQTPQSTFTWPSNIDRAMTDGQGDIDVSDNFCGIVYRMTMVDEWDINRIDPVIIGGPYTSSAQYECNNNNLAGPDNILVLNDGSILVGEDTRKHEYNTVWLWREYIAPVIEVDEQIQLKSMSVINQPHDLSSSWTYNLQSEVSDLAIDTAYTALIVAKNASTEEWRVCGGGMIFNQIRFNINNPSR